MKHAEELFDNRFDKFGENGERLMTKYKFVQVLTELYGKLGLLKSTAKNTEILEAAASFFGFTAEQLLSMSRKRPLVEARYMLIKRLRVNGYTTVDIGKFIGGRDHTTVLHALTTIDNLIFAYPAISATYNQFCSHVENISGGKLERREEEPLPEKKEIIDISEDSTEFVRPDSVYSNKKHS